MFRSQARAAAACGAPGCLGSSTFPRSGGRGRVCRFMVCTFGARKAAVIGLTALLALEFRAEGIPLQRRCAPGHRHADGRQRGRSFTDRERRSRSSGRQYVKRRRAGGNPQTDRLDQPGSNRSSPARGSKPTPAHTAYSTTGGRTRRASDIPGRGGFSGDGERSGPGRTVRSSGERGPDRRALSTFPLS